MPLFRFHRGSLSESLATTIVVKDFDDLIGSIVMSDWIDNNRQWGITFKVIPYPEEGKNFDARIGWYTHMVLADMYEQDKMQPIGFLSEPLN